MGVRVEGKGQEESVEKVKTKVADFDQTLEEAVQSAAVHLGRSDGGREGRREGGEGSRSREEQDRASTFIGCLCHVTLCSSII